MRDEVVAVRLLESEKAALAATAQAQARTLAGMMLRATTLDWLRRAAHFPPAREPAEARQP